MVFHVERQAAVVSGTAAVGVALVVALAAPRSAGAQPPQRMARLTYSRDPAAGRCPDAEEFEDAVAARLGYQPFVASAQLQVVVMVQAVDEGLQARIHFERSGRAPGERTVGPSSLDCRELAEATALVISIAIDPSSLTRAAPRLRQGVDPVDAAPHGAGTLAQPAGAGSASPGGTPALVAASVGLTGSVGAAPGPTLGFRLGFELRWPALLVGLAGRFDLPATKRAAGGDVSASLWLGELSVCGRAERLVACGLLALGAMRGEGHRLADSRTVNEFHAALGGRVGLIQPFADRFSAEFYLDVLANLTRTSLLVGDRRVWGFPVVSAILGGSIALHFS